MIQGKVFFSIAKRSTQSSKIPFKKQQVEEIITSKNEVVVAYGFGTQQSQPTSNQQRRSLFSISPSTIRPICVSLGRRRYHGSGRPCDGIGSTFFRLRRVVLIHATWNSFSLLAKLPSFNLDAIRRANRKASDCCLTSNTQFGRASHGQM